MLKKFLSIFILFAVFTFAEEAQTQTNVIQIQSEQQFQEEVENFSGTVYVDFYAETCPPCKILSPLFSTWSDNLVGKVKFVKVNAHKMQSLVQKYEIRALPTMIVFKNGQVSEKKIGFPDIACYLEDLEPKEQKVQ